MKGKFISFEGIEGSGKSTQGKLLYSFLKNRGADVILTEEPGGTRIGEQIRTILLDVEHRGMSPLTELLLYNASRAQHVQEVILPALNRGATVITDRFTDSTIAYQGYGRGLDLQMIDSLDLIATDRLRPDITLLLDLDVNTGLQRNRGIQKTDRLELETVSFHERVRSGYHILAAEHPARITVIKATDSIDQTHGRIIRIISEVLGIAWH
jgi:dTMP kinase